VSVVDNAVFRLSISSSVPEIFALKSKVVLNRVEFHMFLISIFGGGSFRTCVIKFGSLSITVHDRSTELEDL